MGVRDLGRGHLANAAVAMSRSFCRPVSRMLSSTVRKKLARNGPFHRRNRAVDRS